ncbi:MAG: hypothetical protein Q9159_004286 [Coniocarpon cinnabarinum]
MASLSANPKIDSIVKNLLPANDAPTLEPVPSEEKRPLFPNLTSEIAALQLHPVIECLLHLLNADLVSAHFLARRLQGAVPIRDYDVASARDAASTEDRGPQQIQGVEEAEERDLKERIPPKIEGMLLHAVLHRLEGDYENSRAWYTDVSQKSENHRKNVRMPEQASEDVWTFTYPQGVSETNNFLDSLMQWRVAHEPAYKRTHPDLTASVSNGHSNNPNGTSISHDAQQGMSQMSDIEYLRKWHECELRKLWTWCSRRYGLQKWEQADGEFVDGSDDKYEEMKKSQVVGGEGWRQF